MQFSCWWLTVFHLGTLMAYLPMALLCPYRQSSCLGSKMISGQLSLLCGWYLIHEKHSCHFYSECLGALFHHDAAILFYSLWQRPASPYYSPSTCLSPETDTCPLWQPYSGHMDQSLRVDQLWLSLTSGKGKSPPTPPTWDGPETQRTPIVLSPNPPLLNAHSPFNLVGCGLNVRRG